MREAGDPTPGRESRRPRALADRPPRSPSPAAKALEADADLRKHGAAPAGICALTAAGTAGRKFTRGRAHAGGRARTPGRSLARRAPPAGNPAPQPRRNTRATGAPPLLPSSLAAAAAASAARPGGGACTQCQGGPARRAGAASRSPALSSARRRRGHHPGPALRSEPRPPRARQPALEVRSPDAAAKPGGGGDLRRRRGRSIRASGKGLTPPSIWPFRVPTPGPYAAEAAA